MQEDSGTPNATTRANEFLEYSDGGSRSGGNEAGQRYGSAENEHSTRGMASAGSFPSDPHWTSRITTNDHCLSCETPRTGDYCAKCGQKFLQQRLALWELIKALFSRVTDLESGLLHTVVAMFRRPGTVCREYVMGNQKAYSNPLTYYFLGAGAQILAYWSMFSTLRAHIVENFETQTAAFPKDRDLEKLLGKPLTEALADSYLSAMLQGYAYAGLFAFVLPFAVVLWFLHGALGERFRVGETFVFALFTFSQILFLTAVFGLVTFRLGAGPHLVMALIVYGVFPQLAHTRFFNSTWPSRAITLVATVMSLFCLFIGITVLFIATFGIQVALATQAAS
ncbi:MAG: DUF3667 domain-containing protein [Pirellulaceae bacterium]